MAEIIINTKEVIKRKSYYPDFINIIIVFTVRNGDF